MLEQISGGECPRCGAAYEPLQEYCVECGVRLPIERGIGHAVGRAWRLEVSRYPGGWLWVVLVLLAITVAAAVAAILASGKGESAVRTIVATAPPPTVEPPTPTATAFVPTTTAPATTATTTRPSKQTNPIEWPQGRSAHTVVVGSVPTTDGREAALRRARTAIRAGLPRVGVLDSSEFASLRPDYFVIFSGIYDTEDEALAAVEAAESRGYRRAYEREITP
jgi:hypothetical protein